MTVIPHNSGETPLETLSDRELLEVIAGRLGEFSNLLAEFRPLLDAWRSTNGGTVGLWKARKAMRG